ncbi:hypothetical protein R5R35_002659 [Gryllus longicercus]|uniref:Uncharacterized protein n=1 Tax=Gryllus longicercus TaxID=2509291 RepID=A0AAN9WJM1_9ORTH
MSALPPKSGKGALPRQPYAAWARAVKATDVKFSSASSVRKLPKSKVTTRKVATIWVMGLEEQNKSEEGIRDRKAKFRRKYVEELLRVTTVQGFLNFSFRDRHYSEQ